jgi:putative ABC transport system permease protein
VNKNLPSPTIQTMDEILADSLAQPRFQTVLLSVFGILALFLAAVGIYGVVSYSVSQRTHEIGIRMALGAQKGNVLQLVVRQGLRLVFAGVAVGLAAAFVVTRVLRSLLYEVNALDPLTFVSTTLVLLTVALLACWLPARRAAKVDPMVALRYE